MPIYWRKVFYSVILLFLSWEKPVFLLSYHMFSRRNDIYLQLTKERLVQNKVLINFHLCDAIITSLKDSLRHNVCVCVFYFETNEHILDANF